MNSKTSPKLGRKATKAKPILMRFKKPLDKFIRAEAKRRNQTMVALVEVQLAKLAESLGAKL